MRVAAGYEGAGVLLDKSGVAKWAQNVAAGAEALRLVPLVSTPLAERRCVTSGGAGKGLRHVRTKMWSEAQETERTSRVYLWNAWDDGGLPR